MLASSSSSSRSETMNPSESSSVVARLEADFELPLALGLDGGAVLDLLDFVRGGGRATISSSESDRLVDEARVEEPA